MYALRMARRHAGRVTRGLQESLLTLASCDFLPAAVMIMTDHYVSAPLHTHRDC